MTNSLHSGDKIVRNRLSILAGGPSAVNLHPAPAFLQQENPMKPLSNSKGLHAFPQIAAATGTVLLVLLCTIKLQSQQSTSRDVTVTPSSADYAAAAEAQNVKIHARPAHTPFGRKTG